MTGAVPYRLDYREGAPQVEWIVTGGERFTEPFYCDTIRRLARGNRAVNADGVRRRTPLSTLSAIAPGPSPAAIIFHVSRCGSTLVSRMLAALPNHCVASEPPIVDDLLQTARHIPASTDEERIAWLRGAVAAIGAAHDGGGRQFLKVDCWQIFSLPLIQRAFPGVPLLFIHRHPVEVMVSLLAQPSLTLVRDVVTPAQLGLSLAERDALSPEEYAAAVLGAFFRMAAEHRAALVPVAYEQLPSFVWESMPGIAFTADEKAELQATAAVDAKNPNRPFTPDAQEKRRRASAAILEAFANRAEPHYQRWLTVAGRGGELS